MNIAIVEVIPVGHYTLVESVASIYLSDISTQVTIITNSKGYEVLQHKVSQRLNIIVVNDNLEVLAAFNRLNIYDKIFMITFEPNSKEGFKLLNNFLKSKINVPIYFFLHNIDIWFNQSLIKKIKNIFFNLKSFKIFIYRLKQYFYYYQINDEIIKKILSSGGSFVTLSNSVKKELTQFINPSQIITIPFSCFDESMIKPINNTSNDKLIICIPGFVSNYRRDYFSVLELFSKDTDNFIKNNYIFDFAGGLPSNEDISGLLGEINFWKSEGYEVLIHKTNYLKLVQFDECLQQSDLIFPGIRMPL